MKTDRILSSTESRDPKTTETGKTETPRADLAGETRERSRKPGALSPVRESRTGARTGRARSCRCDLELTSGPRTLNPGRAQENHPGKPSAPAAKSPEENEACRRNRAEIRFLAEEQQRTLAQKPRQRRKRAVQTGSDR
jgi:hypothetical protein